MRIDLVHEEVFCPIESWSLNEKQDSGSKTICTSCRRHTTRNVVSDFFKVIDGSDYEEVITPGPTDPISILQLQKTIYAYRRDKIYKERKRGYCGRGIRCKAEYHNTLRGSYLTRTSNDAYLSRTGVRSFRNRHI